MATKHTETEDTSPSPRLHRLRLHLGAPVDIAGLVYFRIAFGAIMFWEMYRFLDPDHQWVERYYTGKDFYFKYWPFTFVDPLPEPWIQLVFYATGLAAVFVVIGLFYRASATALFLGLSYIFLLEKARYLNHFYLIVLIAFLLIWLPANRSFSVDARRKPSIRSETTPAWALWLVRFQVGVPYFFGGIGKLNGDWLQGEPLRAWLADRTDFPLIGSLFTHEPVVWVMTYAALLLDLFVVFALLNRRTRLAAFTAAIAFHLMNSRLFGIGVFPWTMIAGTVMFFDPSWPRLVIADLKERVYRPVTRIFGLYAGAAIGFLIGVYMPETFSPWRAAIGALAVAVAGYHLAALAQPHGSEVPERQQRARKRVKRKTTVATAAPAPLRTVGVALLAVWVAVQVLVPLRHFAIPGNVHWTEEGHNFSWHMKLRDKDSDSTFIVTADGETFRLNNWDYLTDRQVGKMSSRPHMMVQYAHYLEDEFRAQGYQDVEVRADVWASLNGREIQRLIDPDFDLTTESYPWFGHAEWILPLDGEIPEDSVLDPGDEE